MATGSLSLADYPYEVVRLACSRCERRGQYAKAKLLAAYGQDVALPDLRDIIARCARRGSYGDACGVRYPDLAPTTK